MTRASTDNRRCKDKGPLPPPCNISPSLALSVAVTSSLFVSKPLVLPLRLPLSPLNSSPLSHPFSISPSIRLSLLTPPPQLFSLPPVIPPPPLCRVYCSRKSSTDTSMCVFVHVCVCVCVHHYGRSMSEPHTIMCRDGGREGG